MEKATEWSKPVMLDPQTGTDEIGRAWRMLTERTPLNEEGQKRAIGARLEIGRAAPRDPPRNYGSPFLGQSAPADFGRSDDRGADRPYQANALINPAPTPKEVDAWAHRSQKMRCGTCMWFAEKPPGELGRCRKHAPTLNGWPAVYAGRDWCGDHKLDERHA